MTIEAVSSPNRQFHLILDTVSAAHDMNAYLNLLGRDGNLTLVGMTERPFLMPTLHIGGYLFDQILSISALLWHF
jgi:D-arabinose 1-dehydrogenase-like Zn-dependent alcohol dehydrogenase